MQFEILSMKDGAVNLSYINAENAQKGCCNMWQRQGFIRERSLPNGQTVTFEDGDFLLFDMENTINSDYVSFGTH